MATCSRCGAVSGEETRFCAICGAPLAEPPEREARKVVTILFCDLVESTKLAERFDPEALQRLLARYFVGARTIVERHGGTVEKFIGDAVCAVFGMPAVREDDALRGVRAAVELRDAVVSLDAQLGSPGLVTRIGVNTGEVFAAGTDLSVAGDAVWTAKRLEEAAPRGGILLGPTTWTLVRGEVDAEQLPPVPLKGKQERIDVFLLKELRPGVPGAARRLDSPLVGRARELAELRSALAEAEALAESRLVMLLGPAGIGKTRLVRELAVGAPHARLLAGRCLPYGDGITYWPLVEVVRHAAGLGGDEPATEARERLGKLLANAPDANRIVDGVAAAVGLGGEASAAEVFLAARRLLECLAHEQPLMVVLDDLQWAEPVFCDLVQYVARESRGAPLVLCCVARPEFLEGRLDWSAARTIELEALPAEETRLLISNLLGHELGAVAGDRVAAAAEGNPLFVEELLRMLVDEDVLVREEGDWRIARDPRGVPMPASITALLTARLDRLPSEERLVIERAAVIGEVFSIEAVGALVDAGEVSDLKALLRELEGKELVRARMERRAGEAKWRFGHILVRDAAYAGLPKLARAELHERVARSISDSAGELEVDEIAGYHLAEAAGALVDLDPLDERAASLAAEAAARLASGARRALARGDRHATVALLERAVSLLGSDDPERLALLVDLGAALKFTGRLDEAGAWVREAADRADASELTLVAHRASLELADLHWYTAPERGTHDLWRAATEAIPVFEREEASAPLAEAWWALAEVHLFHCEFAKMRAAVERGLEAAQGASREERARFRSATGLAAMLGPTPVEKARRLCAQLRGTRSRDTRSTQRSSSSMRRISRRWTAASRRRALGRRRRARRWRSSDGGSCSDRNGVMPVRSSCSPATPPPPRACCATGSGRCASSASAGTRLRSQPTSREHCMFSDGTAKRRQWQPRRPTWGALTTSRCRCSRALCAPVREEPPAPSMKRLRSRARRSTSPSARTRRRCGETLCSSSGVCSEALGPTEMRTMRRAGRSSSMRPRGIVSAPRRHASSSPPPRSASAELERPSRVWINGRPTLSRHAERRHHRRSPSLAVPEREPIDGRSRARIRRRLVEDRLPREAVEADQTVEEKAETSGHGLGRGTARLAEHADLEQHEGRVWIDRRPAGEEVRRLIGVQSRRGGIDAELGEEAVEGGHGRKHPRRETGCADPRDRPVPGER